MQPGANNRFQNEHKILIAILLLALINGLLYVIIMPPWQHYDEPNHFEYVWLMAKHPGSPKPGDYDTGMRRDVAQSMIEHNFFSDGAALPDLNIEKPWIGQYQQLTGQPLYYLLASIPLRLLPIEDVTLQLYAARLVSLTIFLVTVLTGYGLAAEITPDRHPLRFMVPITMALLPSFVDLMTAVNNDAAAIAAFSLFLWGCVRLVRRGPSWLTLLWVLIACALCLFTKRTVYLALPLLGIALLFAFLRGKLRKVAWGLVIVSTIVGVLAVFSWGDAALWYRDTTQNSPTRGSGPQTPVGNAAFRLTIQPWDPAVKLVQIIPLETASQLSGTPVTLGAWIWASQPIEGRTPRLQIYDGAQIYSEPVRITESPQFFAVHITPQGNTRRAWVILEPSGKLDIQNPVEVYYDGVILAAGAYPVDQTPQFDENGASGTWGSQPFENLLRNPSAESGWLYLRPWADKFLSQFFSDYKGQESYSLTIYTLVDWSSAGWYYQTALVRLFRTFWAKFAWGHVSLIGSKPYRVLSVITLTSFIGVVVAFWQRRQRLSKLPWDAYFLLGLTFVLVWGMTIVRGTTYIFRPVYFPVARYAYPAIVPSVLLLNAGWLSILLLLEKSLYLPGWVKYAIHLGSLLILDIYALSSIINFYG